MGTFLGWEEPDTLAHLRPLTYALAQNRRYGALSAVSVAWSWWSRALKSYDAVLAATARFEPAMVAEMQDGNHS